MRHVPRLFLDHDLLALSFPKDDLAISEIKRIPGAWWDPDERLWRAPIEQIGPVSSFALAKTFKGLKFAIDPDCGRLITAGWPTHALCDVQDDKIRIHFDYDDVQVAILRDLVPGVKFVDRREGWTAPIGALTHARTWAEKFNVPMSENFEIALAEKDALAWALEDLSHSLGCDLENLDGLGRELWPFQKASVAYASIVRRCLIADDAGLGKTGSSLATILATDSFPTLAVVPSGLLLKWKLQVEMWLPNKTVQIVKGTKGKVEGADVSLVGWGTVAANKKALIDFPFASAIWDESHFAKHSQILRSKAALAISRSLDPDAVILALSATPMDGPPSELVHQLDILGRLDDFCDKQYFETRWCNGHIDKWGRADTSGASHLEELHSRLRQTVMIRRTTEEVHGELPLRHDPIPVEGDPKLMGQYRKAEKDIAKYMAEKAVKIAAELGLDVRDAAVRARLKAEAAKKLVEMSQLRQLAALAKLPAVREWVSCRTESGAKVILAAHHREVVDALAGDGLKLRGGMSVAEIQASVDAFQSLPVDQAPTITLAIEAAKEGHDLTASHDVAFVEFPWTRSAIDQCVGRAYGRMNDAHGVLVSYFYIPGTCDEILYNLVRGKGTVVSTVLDGTPAEDMPELPEDIAGDLAVRLAEKQLGFDLGPETSDDPMIDADSFSVQVI